MGAVARIFSSPRRQLAIATDRLHRGKTARARRATDAAIGALQRRFRKGRGDARALLSEAWLLRGRLQLRAGEPDDAFRCFFAANDRVADDERSLSFVV